MENTIVYLIRHSIRFDTDLIKTYNTSQNSVLKNEKVILSVEGEKRAEILSNQTELQNIDVVYASNCVRTLQTAKYLLEKQSLDVNIDERFDERRLGKVDFVEEKNWFELQFTDENYKTEGGESQIEVRNRFSDAFNEVVNHNKGKRIAIFTHGMAIAFFLLKWCKLEDITEKKLRISFNGRIVADKRINAPDVFKIILDDNNEPVEITNIEFDDLPQKY